MARKAAGHKFKMAAGMIRNGLQDASSKEKAELLQQMADLQEEMGIPVTQSVEQQPEPEVEAAATEEVVTKAVPSTTKSKRPKVNDLSAEKERVKRRLRQAERQLERGQNPHNLSILVDVQIPKALEIIEEAEYIPCISRRYGCAIRGETVELEGYRDDDPIRFVDWMYETDDPIEIAYLERRINDRIEANTNPTRNNQLARSSAVIQYIGNREPMVNWQYTSMFAGFKTPEDADFEENNQQQIRASKRIQRLRA